MPARTVTLRLGERYPSGCPSDWLNQWAKPRRRLTRRFESTHGAAGRATVTPGTAPVAAGGAVDEGEASGVAAGASLVEDRASPAAGVDDCTGAGGGGSVARACPPPRVTRSATPMDGAHRGLLAGRRVARGEARRGGLLWRVRMRGTMPRRGRCDPSPRRSCPPCTPAGRPQGRGCRGTRDRCPRCAAAGSVAVAPFFVARRRRARGYFSRSEPRIDSPSTMVGMA